MWKQTEPCPEPRGPDVRSSHPVLSAVAGSRVHRAGVPLSRTLVTVFHRATPEVTGNRVQAPEPCTNNGLLAAEHSVGPPDWTVPRPWVYNRRLRAAGHRGASHRGVPR